MLATTATLLAMSDNASHAGRGDPPAPLHGAPLLMRSADGVWGVPATTTYGTERDLRDLLASNPSIIPGVSDPAAAAVTELRIGRDRADVVVVESSGTITVCEAKLAANAEIRRTVVGQIFAYVAGLSQMDIESFEQAWLARGGGALLESVLGADATDEDREALRGTLSDNLSAGQFRLLLAVDSLTDELRLIVGYMAAHLDVEVIALELAYASHGGVEVLVPRTWGTELSGLPGDGRIRRTAGHRAEISEALDSLTRAADAAEPGFGAVVHGILTALDPKVKCLYSGAAEMVDPVVVVSGPPARQPAKIVTSQHTPGVQVCFQWCRRLPTETLDAALAVLARHPLIAPTFDGVRDAAYNRRPLVPYVGVLDQRGTVDVVIEALAILAE